MHLPLLPHSGETMLSRRRLCLVLNWLNWCVSCVLFVLLFYWLLSAFYMALYNALLQIESL